MVKFRIYSKIWEGERCKFAKVLEKCQNYRFFYTFSDILDKMNDNLDQECVKGVLLSFQAKLGPTAADFPGKITVFPVVTLLLHLSLNKIWLSHPHKNYIVEMSNNRSIC